MTGAEVKQLIVSAGLKCWQVAELWGVNDSNFSRRHRKPFNESEVERLKANIDKLSAQRNRLNATNIQTAKQALMPAYENTHVSAPIIPHSRAEMQVLNVADRRIF